MIYNVALSFIDKIKKTILTNRRLTGMAKRIINSYPSCLFITVKPAFHRPHFLSIFRVKLKSSGGQKLILCFHSLVSPPEIKCVDFLNEETFPISKEKEHKASFRKCSCEIVGIKKLPYRPRWCNQKKREKR